MQKHYLYLQGGLGNQLYILSYAHFLKTKRSLHNIRLFGNRISRKDTTNKSKRNVFLRLPEMVGFPLMRTPYVVFSTLMKVDCHPLCKSFIEVHREDADKWAVFDAAEKSYDKAINIHRGYYQSHKYLDESFSLTLQHAIRELGKNSYSKDITANDVAVHIRRGDFLKESNLQTFNFVEIDYYLRGLKRLSENQSIAKVYVFSDNFAQIRNEIAELEKKYRIICVKGNTVLQDLALFTRFKNFVIGNSTFSWWGARLSEYTENSHVIVPRTPWVKPMPDATPYPDNWLKI